MNGDLAMARNPEEKRVVGCPSASTATFLWIIRRTFMSKQTKNLIYLALVTASILMVPLVGMQFSDEVLWTLSDFVFAGTLIFGTGLLYQLATRMTGNAAYRTAVGL